MTLTIDNIAKALMEWCYVASPKLQKHFVEKEGWHAMVKKEFSAFINEKTKNNVLNEHPVYESPDKIDLLFNPQAENPSEKIIAELSCESFEDRSNFEDEVLNDIKRL